MARPKKATTSPKPTPNKRPTPDIVGGNEPQIDQQMRTLAILHRDKYAKLKAVKTKADRDMREHEKLIKEDGLSVRQIKIMIELSTPEGEAAFRMSVANDLIAAQFQGAAIGAQLALFLEPDRTPAVDIGYDTGTRDCMEGKTCRPPYDPSVPQYAAYMRGFQDEQERLIKSGIRKLEKPSGFIPISADELADQQAEAKRLGSSVPGKLN